MIIEVYKNFKPPKVIEYFMGLLVEYKISRILNAS